MKLLFLIILLDDVSFEFLTQNQAYHPNITALRQEGVLVEDAWSMPSCSPTRASILTGRYNTGIGYRVHPTRPFEVLNPKLKTLPEKLGGPSAHIGKWHVTTTMPKGFRFFSGMIEGKVKDYFNWIKNRNGKLIPVTNYHTSEIVDDAIRWLPGKSGLLWVAFSAPHEPIHTPPKRLTKHATSRYTKMLEAADTEIGRLLASVDMSRTYVFLLSDNGTPKRNREGIYRRYPSKGTLHQGGIHVPMFVAGPGIPKGGTVKGMVHVKDIHDTILDLADRPGKKKNSFKESLFDPNIPTKRSYNFSQIYNTLLGIDGKAVRNQRYKLIKTGRKKFYDLQEDPFEQVNLLSINMSLEEVRNYKEMSRWLRSLP